ncbi:MAG: hypothetical protein ACREJQ_08210, partial [bacterium]
MKRTSALLVCGTLIFVLTACSPKTAATMIKDFRGIYVQPPPSFEVTQYNPSDWPKSGLVQLGDLKGVNFVEGTVIENSLGVIQYSFTLA